MGIASRMLVTVAVLAGCAGPAPIVDGGRDAGTDAGRDGGRDAGRDASADAGRDAGPDDPEWVPYPDLPEGCVVYRALHPERVAPPIEWRPCEGFENCMQEVSHPRWISNVGAWSDGTRGWVFRSDRLDEDERIFVLQNMDGVAVAAWRSSKRAADGPLCQAGLFEVNVGWAAFEIIYYGPDAGVRTQERIYHAPIEEIGRVETPVFVLTPSEIEGSLVQHLAVSAEMVVAEVQSLGALFAIRGGELRRLDGGPATGNPQRAIVIGTDVFWLDYGARVRVAHASWDEPASILLANGVADEIRGFRTDGRDHVWLELDDLTPEGTSSRRELWTSPYATSPAEVVPRLVSNRGVYHPTYGDGIYASRRTGTLAAYRGHVLDIRTGIARSYETTMPVIDDPWYATAAEVAFRVGTTAGPILVRVDPRTLPIAE